MKKEFGMNITECISVILEHRKEEYHKRKLLWSDVMTSIHYWKDFMENRMTHSTSVESHTRY